MSVRLSIYDFFAYTIPGGLYVFTIAYACSVFGWVKIDWLNLDLSAAQMVVAAGLAYIAGLTLDRVARPWYRRFKPKNLPEAVFREFQQTYPSLEMRMRPEDWRIVLAYIRRESLDLATEIERDNASSIMLRNISLGFLILTLVQVVQFARTRHVPELVLGAVLAGISILAVQESVKFARWFYVSTFEAVACRSLKDSALVVSKKRTSGDRAENTMASERQKGTPARPRAEAEDGQAKEG